MELGKAGSFEKYNQEFRFVRVQEYHQALAKTFRDLGFTNCGPKLVGPYSVDVLLRAE